MVVRLISTSTMVPEVSACSTSNPKSVDLKGSQKQPKAESDARFVAIVQVLQEADTSLVLP